MLQTVIKNKLWDMKYKNGLTSIIQTLISIYSDALVLSDSIPLCLSFGMAHVNFVNG